MLVYKTMFQIMYNPHPLLRSYMIIATITPKQINGEVMHCTCWIIIQRTPKQANHISICRTKPIPKRRSFKPITKYIAAYIQPKSLLSLEILRQRITTQETCFQKMQTQSAPLLAGMLLKVVQTNVFQVGLDFSTEFQMLNKINCMNHIQFIISQPSINLQQGQHDLCLHKFFVVCQLFEYTFYWCLYIKSVQKTMKTWSSMFYYLYS